MKTKEGGVMDIQKIKELALANGFKLKEQASGNMDLNAYVYDFANAIEQEAKAQAVPEGKYILQTFSTYSGVCEDTFNHKDIGVFESIDAAMFHARNIGLVMNHYGYEFRVIEAQEPAND